MARSLAIGSKLHDNLADMIVGSHRSIGFAHVTEGEYTVDDRPVDAAR
jgi:hypothetical protein